MKIKSLFSTTALALCLCAVTPAGNAAHAQQETGSLVYYQVPESEYREHANDWRVFLEYNLHREQCQHYQQPPAGYVMRGCQVYRVEEATVTTTTNTVTEAPPPAPMPPMAVAPAPTPMTYTIYFGVDKASIPADQKARVRDVAEQIQRSNPSDIYVSGYASTTGTSDYNQQLSAKRVVSVVKSLAAEGVDANLINRQAYGETHLAIPTADGVEGGANRRVVIEFNR